MPPIGFAPTAKIIPARQSPAGQSKEDMMGFRTEGRVPAPKDTHSQMGSQTGWPVVEPAATTSPEPQPAIVQLVSDVGSRLMHWAKGGTPPERPTAQGLLPAERAVLGSQDPLIDPSRCHREEP